MPIRTRRGSENGEITADKYYIRRPGPNSEPPRSGLEWDELLRRCIANRDQELEGTIRRILRVSQRAGVPLPSRASDPIDELLR